MDNYFCETCNSEIEESLEDHEMMHEEFFDLIDRDCSPS